MQSLGEHPALVKLRSTMEQPTSEPGISGTEALTASDAAIIHQIETAGGDVNKIMGALQEAAAAEHLGPDPEAKREERSGGGNLSSTGEVGDKIMDAAINALGDRITRGKAVVATGSSPLDNVPDVRPGEAHRVVDRQAYEDLAGQLAQSSLTENQLARLRTGFEDRGLVARRDEARGSQSLLDRALVQAENAVVERAQAAASSAPVDTEADKQAAHRVAEQGRHRQRQAAEQPVVTAAEQRALDQLNQGEKPEAKPGKSGWKAKPNQAVRGPVPGARLDALETESRAVQFDEDMSDVEQARASQKHQPVEEARAAVDAATSSSEMPRPEAVFGSGNKFADNRSIDIEETIKKADDKRSGKEDRNLHPFDAAAQAEAADKLAKAYVKREADKQADRVANQNTAYKSYAGNIKATADRERRELDWDLYKVDRDRGHDEALTMDDEAQAQYEVRRRFENEVAERTRLFNEQISQSEADPTGHRSLPRALRDERDRRIKELEKQGEEAVWAEKARQVKVTQETAELIGELVMHAGNGEAWERTIRAPAEALNDIDAVVNFEDAALYRREVLGVEPLPYRERHYAATPREGWSSLVESHFEIPGQDNLTVIERRDRRTGRLISQQFLSSQEPARHRRGVTIPPVELNGLVTSSREGDLALLKEQKGKQSIWKTFLEGVRDYRSNDIWLGGPGGVYERYGATERELTNYNREKRRRGGEI